jgi:SAM-dependent methyltransferase
MGELAKTMVMRRLTPLWPLEGEDMSRLDVLGFGYTAPYLMNFAPDVRKLILAMPREQGAMVSRSRRGNISCLTEDGALPFPPASFDRVLVAHGLEDTRTPQALLAELWRVLKPEGQIVIIVPNRAGLWARSDASPFGAGRPYSRSQLSADLIAAKFTPAAWSGALYGPPSETFLSLAGGFERFGETVWPRFSGLILVQAIKRLYANTNIGSAAPAARIPKFVGVAPVNAALRKDVNAGLRADEIES